ncbi:MAG: hypothetical protein C0616_02640 [Desulfuromonas sp.]|nr:MAG: hypothetical protein C0616_02640 [Desulfuromonas sp.]
MRKKIEVAFYQYRFVRPDWTYPLDEAAREGFMQNLAAELEPLGIDLSWQEEDQEIEVRGYGDLLNAVRVRSPRDGLGNPCLGHVIGASGKLDLLADIRRGVNRIAFAPETIEPEGHAKQVCHNCGCGC